MRKKENYVMPLTDTLVIKTESFLCVSTKNTQVWFGDGGSDNEFE